ncbi:MAG: hypothetical protein HY825_01020 [Acidobacteria bacterium]|nr:hypothetical protein [Acidobacteriota bacterium]
MTSMLPWPKEYLAGAGWINTRRLLDRLTDAARRGALPGTILLLGEGGMGREAVAVELAAALVCRSAATRPCPCQTCERVRRAVHPDVTIVDVLPGKSEISIAQARDVATTVALLPFESARRVIVLTSAETPPLSAEAASALLKTLEEPPAHVTLVLLAANPARVLPTIVSRSVALRVPGPQPDELARLAAEVNEISLEQARMLLEGGLDVVSGGTEAADRRQVVNQLIRQMLTGDVLAVLRLGALSRQAPDAAAMALGELLDIAREGAHEHAEAALDAATQLIHAVRRHAILRTELEGTLVGALAPLLTGCQRAR